MAMGWNKRAEALDKIKKGKIFKYRHISTKLIADHYFVAYDYTTPIYKKDLNNSDEVFDNRYYSATTTIFQNTLGYGYGCITQKRKERSLQYRKGGEKTWTIKQ